MVAIASKPVKTARRASKPASRTAVSIASREPTPFRFTVQDYYRMGEAGILKHDDRVELIEGEIVMMPPIDIAHAEGSDNSQHSLIQSLAGIGRVRCQQPVRLDDSSEPVPDISVVRVRKYTQHPGPADILLLLEVANTSLQEDLGRKKRLYAAAGIPEYWVLDVVGRELHVFSTPKRGNYAKHEVISAKGTVQSPTLKPLRVKVAELLP